MDRIRMTSVLFVAAVLLCTSATSFAQSAIMNTPSTDVVAPKKVYVEMDFLTNYAWQREGSFQNYIPRVVVGIPGKLEAGVNVSFTHISGQDLPVEVQPNVKWQFYNNEKAGVAGAAGCILYTPMNHRTGTDTLGQCYVVGSKQFGGNLGPRFHGGGYSLVGAPSEQSKRGAILAYEQPLFNRFSFLVDWFSGDNRFGYVSPGISIATSKTTALTTGYAIANHGSGKNAFFIYYGKQFQ
jgi:hypothetical protein